MASRPSAAGSLVMPLGDIGRSLPHNGNGGTGYRTRGRERPWRVRACAARSLVAYGHDAVIARSGSGPDVGSGGSPDRFGRKCPREVRTSRVAMPGPRVGPGIG